MKAAALRKKFIDFFVSKGHQQIPSASLVPENDPSALFINSGMHPLIPYLMGEPHPEGKRLTSVQKCIRTNDIEEVGDTYHHTFFEMLGNWSLGDYFKKKAIELSWEFLTKELKLNPNRLSVTVFKGDRDAPRDQKAALIWRAVGIPQERIYFLGKEDNWWQVGPIGPCGPDTEVFYDTNPSKKKCSPQCQPGCSCGKYREIWNNVFMVFNRRSNGQLEELPQKNVDTGLGLERTLAILNGLDDDYKTELFTPIIKKIEELANKKYSAFSRSMRIIADHLRAACFIITDGITSSNKDQGYILRRLIRRSIRYGQQLAIKENFTYQIAKVVIDNYSVVYKELDKNKIKKELEAEENRFKKTLVRGLKEFEKISGTGQVSGKQAFYLYETYGFPFELTKELITEKKLSSVNLKKDFLQAQLNHQKKSRTAAQGKFAGGLASRNLKVIKLHTATHLLHEALRRILGKHVSQVGSNITSQRLRFDFTHPQKIELKQLKEIEALVNKKIKENLKVNDETMSLVKAKKEGALAFFGQKYPSKVKVYSIGNFSQEVCAGPHINFTGVLGKFMIKKEESCGAGKRRIYAVLKNGN